MGTIKPLVLGIRWWMLHHGILPDLGDEPMVL